MRNIKKRVDIAETTKKQANTCNDVAPRARKGRAIVGTTPMHDLARAAGGIGVLAESLGVSRSCVQKWLSGDSTCKGAALKLAGELAGDLEVGGFGVD